MTSLYDYIVTPRGYFIIQAQNMEDALDKVREMIPDELDREVECSGLAAED